MNRLLHTGGVAAFRIGCFILTVGLLSACATGSQTANAPAEGQVSGSTASGNTSGAGDVVTVREATPSLEPYTADIPGTAVTFEMVPVPAGTITVQTDEGPQTVEIEPFWISQTEVQWDGFDTYAYALDLEGTGMEPGEDGIIRPSKPYGAPDRGFGHEGYAALSMTYGVALEYARWLSEKTGLNYRLPTIAEYEYACRAGRSAPLSEAEKMEMAWYAPNANDKTQPVASKKPNAWGIYDMMGNALEWCTGLDGESEYACGGHYYTTSEETSCGARQVQTFMWNETDPQIPKSVFWLTDATFIGFRLVREP